jgi:tetratricopeptide (TPR) repeat protein
MFQWRPPVFALVSEAMRVQNHRNCRPKKGGAMKITRCKWHAFRLPAMVNSKPALLCALIISLLPAPLLAQITRYPLQDNAGRLPPTPDDRVVVDKNDSKRNAGKQQSCAFQPFPGMATSVSVSSLQIPPKAQREYEQACAALKNKKLPEAERHLHNATEIYPKYVVGWVILGQILESMRQTAEARDACLRASNADPNYLPAYLCLAEIAGREQQWNEVLILTSRALEQDPVNVYAYFFSAIAHFSLDQLPEAEENALKAEAIDRRHDEPLVQYLLAQIYEAKHDSANAAAHRREYLRIAPGAQDSESPDSGRNLESVKKELAAAQSRIIPPFAQP